MTLIELRKNQKAKIMRISGGNHCCKRLCDLGLTTGTIVKVINSAPFHGPLEVEVRGTKLILGRGIASKIIVETLN